MRQKIRQPRGRPASLQLVELWASHWTHAPQRHTMIFLRFITIIAFRIRRPPKYSSRPLQRVHLLLRSIVLHQRQGQNPKRRLASKGLSPSPTAWGIRMVRRRVMMTTTATALAREIRVPAHPVHPAPIWTLRPHPHHTCHQCPLHAPSLGARRVELTVSSDSFCFRWFLLCGFSASCQWLLDTSHQFRPQHLLALPCSPYRCFLSRWVQFRKFLGRPARRCFLWTTTFQLCRLLGRVLVLSGPPMTMRISGVFTWVC